MKTHSKEQADFGNATNKHTNKSNKSFWKCNQQANEKSLDPHLWRLKRAGRSLEEAKFFVQAWLHPLDQLTNLIFVVSLFSTLG